MDDIVIPFSIRPKDSLKNDIAIGDKVAFVLTYYNDRFCKICTGVIVGFTECFVKIKPDNYKEHWSFQNRVDGERYPKDFVKRCPSRVIKIFGSDND